MQLSAASMAPTGSITGSSSACKQLLLPSTLPASPRRSRCAGGNYHWRSSSQRLAASRHPPARARPSKPTRPSPPRTPPTPAPAPAPAVDAPQQEAGRHSSAPRSRPASSQIGPAPLARPTVAARSVSTAPPAPPVDLSGSPLPAGHGTAVSKSMCEVGQHNANAPASHSAPGSCRNGRGRAAGPLLVPTGQLLQRSQRLGRPPRELRCKVCRAHPAAGVGASICAHCHSSTAAARAAPCSAS